MKNKNKIKWETAIIADKSKAISVPERRVILTGPHVDRSNRRLELWRKGIIICGGPPLFETDDTKIE